MSRWRSWVWLAIATAMYASRRKVLRRAALRGLIAGLLTRASLLLPPARGRYADEGAAAAFVAGAALEIPLAALPLAGVAAFAHGDDRHDIEQRLGAVGLGTAIAIATTRAWPVPPRLGSVAPKIQLPAHAEPNAEGDGLTVAVNADSGSDDETPTDALREALPKANIVEFEIKQGDELRKVLDEAVGHKAVALGVAGGDGSIAIAAQVALDAQKALVVVPGGTFNHFTGALGIETVEEAIEAVKSGEAVGVDVATIAGQVFLNTASFGSYVELVDVREKLEKRIGKWPAMVFALIHVLRQREPIEVEIEGERKKIWMAFIGNCRYHPSGFAPSWRERLDDELLDFRYVSGTQPWARTRLVFAVMTGRLGRSKVYHQTCVERLHIQSTNGPMRLARDGETFEGPEDVIIEKLDKRLAVYVPHSKKP